MGYPIPNPPPHPFILALINNSEQGLRDVSAFLRRFGSVNIPICSGHDYCKFVADGDRCVRIQLPIFWAIDRYHWDRQWGFSKLRILLDHGAVLNVIHESRCVTPLYLALAEYENMGLARFLVENGANPNYGADVCPVMVKCIKGNQWWKPAERAYVVKYLLEIGTNPNQCDERGVPALLHAVNGRCPNDDIVKELLRWGANPLRRTANPLQRRPRGVFMGHWQPKEEPKHITPIELACAWGATSTLKIVLSHIPSEQHTAQLMQHPLYLACERTGLLSTVEACLEYIPKEDEKMYSVLLQGALYRACESDIVDTIHFLIKKIML